MREPHSYARVLGLGFAGLAGATLALMVVGALVRAHGAGLSCPDWPLCFGRVLPVFDMRVALEWGHRVFAGSVSLGLLGFGTALLRVPALRQAHGAQLGWIFGLLAIQIG